MLSQLDDELVSRSPLSLIAAQELESHIWQTWDVDHADGNTLLEARPDFASQSMVLFPQVIFGPSGPQIRGDYQEMCQFGPDRFQRVLVDSMLKAFRADEAGEKRLHPKRIRPNPDLLGRYRYPPRIFSRRPIHEFDRDMSFELQYLTTADRRFALSQLESWDVNRSFPRMEVRLGSDLPPCAASLMRR